ncbi:MAG: hypothetical protein EXS63_00510 [Candidatus Omnitrophica bacterium]|nr:hypothetical protein [Candidatus Omnitrophota bacterium]
MKNSQKIAEGFLFFILVLISLSLGIKVLVFKDIQTRIGLQMQGALVPSVFQSRFQINQANFIWKDRVKFISGDLDLRYDLAYFLTHGKWHIQIQSDNAVIYLLGDWAKIQGRGNVSLTQLRADLTFDQKKILDIGYLEAHSPTFNFSIK